ncbi:hypothetical protein B9Z55_019631 [Caenorhabditis nigoni]|uniref:Uncharacterized protein n=1 Tax=Caenorhabditis nigoni TaxID=1611254 RepID=A0A2G5TJC7_9PELO|nr:hypothetical protein B9Z55_019631 [Caenorhabditis nigoni]
MQSIREPRNVELIRGSTKFMRSVSHGRASTWRRNRVRPDNELSASALYQLSNGSPSGGRSQFSPSDLAVNSPIHHVGSRVRVASVNQICDSSSAPQYSIE